MKPPVGADTQLVPLNTSNWPPVTLFTEYRKSDVRESVMPKSELVSTWVAPWAIVNAILVNTGVPGTTSKLTVAVEVWPPAVIV